MIGSRRPASRPPQRPTKPLAPPQLALFWCLKARASSVRLSAPNAMASASRPDLSGSRQGSISQRLDSRSLRRSEPNSVTGRRYYRGCFWCPVHRNSQGLAATAHQTSESIDKAKLFLVCSFRRDSPFLGLTSGIDNGHSFHSRPLPACLQSQDLSSRPLKHTIDDSTSATAQTVLISHLFLGLATFTRCLPRGGVGPGAFCANNGKTTSPSTRGNCKGEEWRLQSFGV